VNRKRMTVLGGFVLGCGLLAVAPAIAGADDPVITAPDTSSKAAVAAAPADYSASLSGGQEVPGNASPAFAMAEFTLSEDGASLSYSARVFGLANPVAAHLHLGPAGENGPVVVPLEVPDQPGTSGCAAIISGGITQLEPPSSSGSSEPTPGEEACAAIVPAPLPTTTTSGPTTSTSEDSTSTSEDTTSTSEAATSTTMHMTSPATPSAAVAFRAEDQACRTLLRPTLVGPPTTSTSTTEGTSTSTTEEASTSTSGGPTSTVITVAPPTTATTGTSTTQPPIVLPTSDGVCGFADVSGVITEADLTGPLAGETLADLVAEIEAGNIYINFHTTALPAGEIRGQLITLNPPAVTTTSTTEGTTSTTEEGTTSTTEGATSTSTSEGTTSTSTPGGTTSTSTSEGTTSTSTSGGTTSTSGDSSSEG